MVNIMMFFTVCRPLVDFFEISVSKLYSVSRDYSARTALYKRANIIDQISEKPDPELRTTGYLVATQISIWTSLLGLTTIYNLLYKTIFSKRNLRFLSKFNQNTVRWFWASFRRVLGVPVTWWCLMNFWRSKKPRKMTKKSLKTSPSHEHPQNSSETCLKSPDGFLNKFWEGSFFCLVQALSII